MLTMPAQRHSERELNLASPGRCSDVSFYENVYENARVFVETMIGGHAQLLKAVPTITGHSAC